MSKHKSHNPPSPVSLNKHLAATIRRVTNSTPDEVRTTSHRDGIGISVQTCCSTHDDVVALLVRNGYSWVNRLRRGVSGHVCDIYLYDVPEV